MELQTIDVPRTGARRKAAEYRRHARHMPEPQASEFRELGRVYELAAKNNLAIISLTETIRAGGSVTRELVYGKGTDSERREYSLLSAIACCRASAQFCWTKGVQREGAIEFVDRPNPNSNLRSGVVTVETGWTLPTGFEQGHSLLGGPTLYAWSSLVPLTPPEHRPAVNSSLDRFHVLWEADDWTWRKAPAPPRDPALLRHLGGDFYAVLATWELTELERMVLAGRRLP